ncbi:MAG: tripartite tricarboxylate transporter substrate binding protein [Burkholderiales bacterium]|nr:tripartite tricarboxylate transporter substrate binding protein [Burkholderiales bacterium]
MRSLVCMVAIGATILGPLPVGAQTYPSRVVRIVTAAPGGTIDLGARLVAQGLSAALGQPVVVENRGVLAAEVVAKATPDGHTLVYYTSSLWLAPFLFETTTWDPIKDFAPISLTDKSPSLLVVHPSLPVQSVSDLIALAKSKPGALNYARASVGSSTQLSAELFKAMSNVNIVSVPYKGGGAALIGVLSGQTHLMFSPLGSVVPHLKPGKLRALAVTSAEPFSQLPDIPTVAASGLPGYESITVVGLFAPAKTPRPIIQRLHQEVVQALQKPEIRDRFMHVGIEPVGSTPDQFAAVVKAEMGKWGKLIKDTGMRGE